MDNSDKDKSAVANSVPVIDKGDKRPKMWGVLCVIAGVIGIAISIYTGFYDFKNIVPLFGTVMAGVLIAGISILLIIYGYRLLKKDL